MSATPTTPVLTRYGATRADVERLLSNWGEPKYRTNQLWAGLTESRLPLDEITSLPLALRERLADALPLALTPAVEATAQDGLTTKWLWRAARDGTEIETVLMRSPNRATVCVSSQAGCAMGCTFCATVSPRRSRSRSPLRSRPPRRTASPRSGSGAPPATGPRSRPS